MNPHLNIDVPFGVMLHGVANWLVRITLLIMIGFISLFIFDRYNQPYHIDSIRILDPAVFAGDPMRVEFQIDRFRICRTDTIRSIIRESDGKELYRNTFPANSFIGEDQINRVTLSVPENLEPGKYRLRYRMDAFCGFNDFHYDPPDNFFQVLDTKTLPADRPTTPDVKNNRPEFQFGPRRMNNILEPDTDWRNS